MKQFRKIAALRRRLVSERKAASTIEFAIIVPVFLIFMFGVLQAGVYLQNYNAVRSTALDGARAIMIEYQKDNTLTDEQIRSLVLARAVNAPYYLESDRLQVNITRQSTSRVSGTTELEVELQYQLQSFIPGLELPLQTISYDRPVFVVA